MQETTMTGTPEEVARDLEAVLARRMEQVELGNQRLRRLNRFSLAASAAALGVSAAVLVVAGVGRSTITADSVAAERFLLRGAGGTLHGEWQLGAGGSSELVLRDGNGRARARLSTLPDGSTGLSLADAGGNSRAALGLLPDQTASLVFADRSGRTRAVLGYSADDAVNLAFADRRGATRAGMGIDAFGRGSLTLPDEAVSSGPAPAAEPEAGAPPEGEGAAPAGAVPGGGTR